MTGALAELGKKHMHPHGDFLHRQNEDVPKGTSDKHEWATCTMWP